MSVDTISNFLTVIRNGLMVGKRSVAVENSKLKQQIADVLKSEGYIKDYTVVRDGAKASLSLVLKYVDGEAVIHEIKRISRPGRRCYERVNQIKPVIGGLGIAILSTSRGIMTDKQALKNSVAGEVICHVW
jgi:small subunit ribosomal protein S8